MWRQQGRHKTGTTGGNSLLPTQQCMELDDDDDVRANLHNIPNAHCVISSLRDDAISDSEKFRRDLAARLRA